MSDSSDLEILEEKPKTKVIELNDSSSSSSSSSTTENDDNKPPSKSNSNKPSGAECLARCKEFAKVTNTDTALAMFYLQDNDWNLEVFRNLFLKILIRIEKKNFFDFFKERFKYLFSSYTKQKLKSSCLFRC